MTSTYYLSYHILKRNGETAWLRTPESDSEADMREQYEHKITKRIVVDCCLCRRDHYEPQEMRCPDRHPNGFDDFRILKNYARI